MWYTLVSLRPMNGDECMHIHVNMRYVHMCIHSVYVVFVCAIVFYCHMCGVDVHSVPTNCAWCVCNTSHLNRILQNFIYAGHIVHHA